MDHYLEMAKIFILIITATKLIIQAIIFLKIMESIKEQNDKICIKIPASK
jgi:hypothetical protein